MDNLKCRSKEGSFTFLDADEVRREIELRGLRIADGSYVGCFDKIDCYCECGERFKTTWTAIRRGKRCEKCRRRKIGDSSRPKLSEVKKYFLARGFTLLENVYVNSNTPMLCRCKCGRELMRSRKSISDSKQCRKCADKSGALKRTGAGSVLWIADRKEEKRRRDIRNMHYRVLHGHLRRTGTKKIGKTELLLGYSKEQLWDHLQSHPKMASVGTVRFSIDHIFPITAFTEHGILDPKIVNALDNLQPMEMGKNTSKFNHYDRKEFLNYMQGKYGIEQCLSWGVV